VFSGAQNWSSLATETNLLAIIFTPRVWELSAGLRQPHPVTCSREGNGEMCSGSVDRMVCLQFVSPST